MLDEVGSGNGVLKLKQVALVVQGFYTQHVELSGFGRRRGLRAILCRIWSFLSILCAFCSLLAFQLNACIVDGNASDQPQWNYDMVAFLFALI